MSSRRHTTFLTPVLIPVFRPSHEGKRCAEKQWRSIEQDRVVDIDGYFEVGPKDITLLGAHTTVTTTLGQEWSKGVKFWLHRVGETIKRIERDRQTGEAQPS